MTYPVHAAKTNLSRLIQEALAGEEVVICRGDKPAVRLVPVEASIQPERQPGTLRGKIRIGPAFFEPLPDDELALWNGENPDPRGA